MGWQFLSFMHVDGADTTAISLDFPLLNGTVTLKDPKIGMQRLFATRKRDVTYFSRVSSLGCVKLHAPALRGSS